jgi:hypothetical protein
LLGGATGPNPSGTIYFDNLLAALRDLGWVDMVLPWSLHDPRVTFRPQA